MTAQNPSVMIAQAFNHLPLALKDSINDKKFVIYVKKLVEKHLILRQVRILRTQFCFVF
jgi:hypothetical protein